MISKNKFPRITQNHVHFPCREEELVVTSSYHPTTEDTVLLLLQFYCIVQLSMKYGTKCLDYEIDVVACSTLNHRLLTERIGWIAAIAI